MQIPSADSRTGITTSEATTTPKPIRSGRSIISSRRSTQPSLPTTNPVVVPRDQAHHANRCASRHHSTRRFHRHQQFRLIHSNLLISHHQEMQIGSTLSKENAATRFTTRVNPWHAATATVGPSNTQHQHPLSALSVTSRQLSHPPMPIQGFPLMNILLSFSWLRDPGSILLSSLMATAPSSHTHP